VEIISKVKIIFRYLLGIIWREDMSTISLCFVWYLSSALKNSFSKEFVTHTPLPVTSSFMESLFTVTFTVFTVKFQKPLSQQPISQSKEIIPSWSILWTILPICIASVIGHTLTQISLEFIQVSFTHTIKSLSPIFTLLMAYFIMGDSCNKYMVLSVVPIVCGVFLSSSVELDFNIIGCGSALLSCFAFCFQNIYAKRIVEKNEIDPFYLLIHSNAGATFLLFLLALAFEWTSIADFTNAHLVVLDSKAIFLICGVGFFHFIQSISAISFLAMASSVSYSIANTFKRVFVIILSIIYFGNEVSMVNYMGILLSVLGIILYNRANEKHRSSLVSVENPPKGDCIV